MKKIELTDNHIRNGIAVTLAFVAVLFFFELVYPYHLIRREQMNLFLLDWDYIVETYSGTSWLARLVSDFIEQFFCFSFVGPLLIALLLTAIAVVTYRWGKILFGQKWAFLTAVLVYFWTFFRETGNLYLTRYTIAVLGYMCLIYIVCKCKGSKLTIPTAIVSIVVGIWAFGSPVDKNYGKWFSLPKMDYERLMALDASVAREDWDKVIELSQKDLYMTESSYCYNLAQAMKGRLGDCLCSHSQNGPATLLIRIAPNQTAFRNCLAGEAWFHLGEMTIAEQSAIIALQASPKHTGARYVMRLARVNLISGETASAQKYLNMLSKTLVYRKWALSMMPESQNADTELELDRLATRQIEQDYVHHSYENRTLLLSLLEADADNSIARNYLLCNDLLAYDIDNFMNDYAEDCIKGRNYHEAALIWLSQHNILNESHTAQYGISDTTVDRMGWFFRNHEKYKDTYWYYYMSALNETDQ